MQPVTRVKSYRGFVFASEAADGPSLEESLGHMLTSLDDMIDRAPDGEIEAAGGVFKHAYDGNWKLYFENLCDAAHPLFAHRSSIEASQAQSDDVHSDGSGEIAIRQMRQNGAPYSFWEIQVGIWTYPNGHSYLGDYHDDSKLVAALKDPVFRDYLTALEKKKGKTEAQRILEVRRWNSNIYPNVSLMSQFAAASRGASDRGQPHRGAHLQFPAQGRAGADVPQHHQLRQHRQRHRLAGADRRSRNLQPHRHGPVERGRGVAADRPRLSERRARRAWRPEGHQLDQRGLYPQHARRLAGLHEQRPRARAARARRPDRDGEEAKARPKIAAPRRRRATPLRGRPSRAEPALDLHRCELFLEHEARLLDEAKFDDWLALFTADAWYWVPSEPDQANPHDTVSLIYDDRRLLETRVRRLASPRMYSQEPRSRTSRHRRQRHDRGRRRPRRDGALEIPDDRIPARAAAAVRRHGMASAGADRRRRPHRLEARRSGQLRRAAGWDHPAVLMAVAPLPGAQPGLEAWQQ